MALGYTQAAEAAVHQHKMGELKEHSSYGENANVSQRYESVVDHLALAEEEGFETGVAGERRRGREEVRHEGVHGLNARYKGENRGEVDTDWRDEEYMLVEVEDLLVLLVHEGNESRTGLDDVSLDREGVVEGVASPRRLGLYLYLDRRWCLEVNLQVRHHRLLSRVVHHRVSESGDEDVWRA